MQFPRLWSGCGEGTFLTDNMKLQMLIYKKLISKKKLHNPLELRICWVAISYM